MLIRNKEYKKDSLRNKEFNNWKKHTRRNEKQTDTEECESDLENKVMEITKKKTNFKK